MQFSAAELAKVMGGRLAGADAHVDGVAIDSRLVDPGQLFVALKGDRDGHDFVPSALAAGAAAVLVDRAVVDTTSIVVDSVDAALVALARHARSRLSDKVIGITGSVGKTTTKDLLASVLSQRYLTAASEKSFNNEIGVPLTLANSPEGTEVAVVEMGARGLGHIRHLCEMAEPTVGIVTTVEAVHTEVMGDVAQIAKAKAELIESLPASGLAVLNSDVALVAAMGEKTSARVLTFGRSGDLRARGVHVDGELVASFVLVSPWGEVSIRLGVRGAHNVGNALAAAAAGLAMGVSLEDVALGLETPLVSPLRMDLRRASGGALVLNDSYNAGPASMAAALRALSGLEEGDGTGRRFAVLGLMAELGDGAATEHLDIAALAADLGISVIAVGTSMYGLEPVADIDEAFCAIKEMSPGSGDAVLVKGSRVAGLEVLAERLLEV